MNKLSPRTISAIVIGNALEWYDFIVYSLLTVYIAKLFFPMDNSLNSLLAATASFGVAFLMRPVGGILLGIYADKVSRKAALLLGIIVMVLALLLISFTPTYSKIGIFAPVLIVLARLLQGFSAGGEFSTATSMLIEMAPPHQKRFYTSWQMAGQAWGKLIGLIICFCVFNVLTTEQIENWGWRIPFILGLIILPVGYYIRTHLKEISIPQKPSIKIFNYWPQLLIALGLTVGCTASTYINLTYMPTYAHVFLNMPLNLTYYVAIGSVVLVTLIPLFGKLADRIGTKKILLTGIILYLLCIYPLFVWLNTYPTITNLVILQCIVCFFLSMYFSVFSAIMAELFPAEIRSTSLSISYNLAVMLFGGFAQFIVTFLIKETGSPISVTYYLLVAMSITFIAALTYRDTGTKNYEQTRMAYKTDCV